MNNNVINAEQLGKQANEIEVNSTNLKTSLNKVVDIFDGIYKVIKSEDSELADTMDLLKNKYGSFSIYFVNGYKVLYEKLKSVSNEMINNEEQFVSNVGSINSSNNVSGSSYNFD